MPDDYTKQELLLLLILEAQDERLEQFYKELEEGQEDESGKGS